MLNTSREVITEEQTKQWNLYACVPRCIIQLAEKAGKPLTKEEFCKKWASLFDSNKYGLLGLGQVQQIAMGLGIGKQIVSTSDYSQVQAAFDDGRPILMISHVDLKQGGMSEINHCSVLTKVDGLGFSIWTPSQTGENVEMDFTANDWQSKQCWAMIMR